MKDEKNTKTTSNTEETKKDNLDEKTVVDNSTDKKTENENTTDKKNKALNKSTIIIAVLAAIILVAALFYIINKSENSKFAFSQIKNTIEAGEPFIIEDFIVLDDENTVATVNPDSVSFNALGENTVSFTITNNNKERQANIKVDVIDTVAPVIEGDSEITVLVGDKIDWSKYTVKDFEELTANDIQLDKEVDTSSEATVSVTLSAKDSSGNEGKKDVKVTVLGATPVEEAVITAMEYANKDSIENAIVFDAGEDVYFIQIDDAYVVLDGEDKYDMKKAASMLGYSYDKVKEMVVAVGTPQDASKINKFANRK